MKTDISRFFTVCYIFFGTFFFAICLSLYSDMMFAMRESLDDHASEHASKRDADEIEGSTAHERRHRKTMKDSKIKVACTWVKNHLLSGGKRFILIIFAVLCVVGGTVFGVVVEGWTVIQALYFAVTAMSTGGMQAPNKDTPGVFLSAQNTHRFFFSSFAFAHTTYAFAHVLTSYFLVRAHFRFAHCDHALLLSRNSNLRRACRSHLNGLYLCEGRVANEASPWHSTHCKGLPSRREPCEQEGFGLSCNWTGES